MANKTIIYSKQVGKPLVPVTARIEWFSDGIIKPLMFWMPDGSCYQVNHTYEMTQLAFLRDRGKGIRFKVNAKAIETIELVDNPIHAQYDTYLYFADNWFCGKNIIDGRYGHVGKEYVPVILDIFPDANYELIYFWVKGARYMVEKKIKVEPRGSFRAGGVGMCHKVEARLVNADNEEDPNPSKSVRRMAALYLEINKWFVTVNAT